MLKKNIQSALLALSLVTLPFSAFATPVKLGFEGVVGDSDSSTPITPYTESGFTLTNLKPTPINDGIFGKTSGVNTNGSAVFGFCAYDNTCDRGTAIRLTGAAPFSLNSIEIASLFPNFTPQAANTSLQLIGTLFGGGTITTTLSYSTTWAAYSVSGFSNLQSLELRGINDYAVGIDNLILNADAGNRLPEPGSLALSALALTALGLRRRASVQR
ncbi:PEP-CTERM sorting domain-containing protein [Paucibacter sp. APW11]|uniref:PEP-CTERM sorting domain-containing protein n=1 Tax=Roseateles aquae TaxID=3077235 RepID=A0ABU3PB25_9BURK|nr:PEP-CTERM sorting domain-containing protein [Paucibacter sp. APW11]MDT8999775.1 PEP-CTERM sorting domain-containing protein [Paucibacter sp. APW11]